MRPRVIFDFPVSPWYPGDPIIRDGIEFVIGDLGRFTAYGGDETYRDAALADQLAANHDALLVAGTPAFWDANDRDIFRSAIERDLPIVIWGIGSGGGDRPWKGLAQDTELFQSLATYPRLEALVLRDEATHQLFRTRGASHGEIMICPGFFALPSPRLRTSRKIVALDLLDPQTVEKDGLYECWRYYASTVEVVRALRARGTEIRLVCQRAGFDHGFDDVLRNPHSWRDASGLGLIDWLDAVDMPRDLIDGLRDLPDRAAFIAFYSDCDVYIGTRIHGAVRCPAPEAACRRLPSASICAVEPGCPPPRTSSRCRISRRPSISISFVLGTIGWTRKPHRRVRYCNGNIGSTARARDCAKPCWPRSFPCRRRVTRLYRRLPSIACAPRTNRRMSWRDCPPGSARVAFLNAHALDWWRTPNRPATKR
jgi:hypothetical protein